MSDMTLPAYEPFYLEDLDQLRAEIARLGLDLPVEDDFSSLAEPWRAGDVRAPNRFCALPIEGRDAQRDGSPGRLTRRRYRRLAQGGFGLIWIEGAAVTLDARVHPSQLCLHDRNVEAYAAWVKELRTAARADRLEDVLLILQLTHPSRAADRPGDEGGMPPLLSDDELEGLPPAFARAATLAVEAGFDGVDVCARPTDIVGNLLAGFTRPGPFGGDFEGRTRFLLEIVSRIRRQAPDVLLASRLNVFHAVGHPYGFGVDRADYRRPDLAEPARLVERLAAEGVSLLGITAASPNLRGTMEERAHVPGGNADPPDEHPLTVLARHITFARDLSGPRGKTYQSATRVPLQRDPHVAEAAEASGIESGGISQRESAPTAPAMSIVGTGYTWLRQFLPHVAAGAVREGLIEFVGMGRSALAYSDAPAALWEHGRLDAGRCCMVCFACAELSDYGGPVGCVIRDQEVYGPAYRNWRRMGLDHLAEEAGRCHQCEAAPCSAACPTRTDIPAFLRAFAQGDLCGAYRVIRRRDPLPELTSHLSPSWLESEGACIETALTGRPVPILDIQYTVSCLAREQGLLGLALPDRETGRRVAVVGGGPAGLAATIRLVEQGHRVDLLEKTSRLGGIPERVIPAERFAGVGPEIDAVLQPALDAGRICIRFGDELGRSVTLDELREKADAVLLAAGLWQEPSLGRVDGVVGALAFLERAKQGNRASKPKRVAILAGGDAAMDAAVTAKALGANHVYVVFGGSRAEMHWHLPDAWFATPGVHALMLTQPTGYRTNGEGRVVGVRVHRMEPGGRPASGESEKQGLRGTTAPVRDSECLLDVDLVIEAMGLEIEDGLRGELGGAELNEHGLVSVSGDRPYSTGIAGVFVAGALINGGASVARCVAEGVAAAEEIDRCLS